MLNLQLWHKRILLTSHRYVLFLCSVGVARLTFIIVKGVTVQYWDFKCSYVCALLYSYETGLMFLLTSPEYKRIAAIQGDLFFQAPRRLFLKKASQTQPAFAFRQLLPLYLVLWVLIYTFQCLNGANLHPIPAHSIQAIYPSSTAQIPTLTLSVQMHSVSDYYLCRSCLI